MKQKKTKTGQNDYFRSTFNQNEKKQQHDLNEK